MGNGTPLVDEIAEQEHRLVFESFDEDTALALGETLVGLARASSAPVVINIRTPNRTLFHAAMPGSAPDNDVWARRKSNVTLRLHKASMWVGENNRLKGRTLGPDHGFDPMDYADHGGSFPIRVKGTGVVAAVTVSGLPSADDHAMIIKALEAQLSTR
ncbi:heme-degrading domain-containing protein [Ciceribacter sp. L1K23]|uniref:heme-degrading domain-containing protein n=1 Tax=Ciceribacter sp. L1K23 TaxID=2820276 RepID=UPI001B825D54|nr:heme-degrading domain-containing protein [Ciceribacter sp. L1K23]MBR0554990.1 heme-degrading domain-containing protein [Ciceribacter sp. L1K23]